MTCIVSAYFKIPSKKPHDWYVPYLIRFFKGVNSTKLVFFTTDDVIEELKPLVDLSNVRFLVMNFEDINAFKQYGREFWEIQYERDPERYHSLELGAIWYEKKEFILKASQYVKANVYIWCDAGCVRDDISSHYLQNFGERSVDLNDGKIHLQLIKPHKKCDFYVYSTVYIGCGIIAGNINAWVMYKNLYDTVLEKYNKNKISGTSDQYITASCIDEIPELFKLYGVKTICDEWFKFLELL
jgi:hypothetical protein